VAEIKADGTGNSQMLSVSFSIFGFVPWIFESASKTASHAAHSCVMAALGCDGGGLSTQIKRHGLFIQD